MGHLAVAMETQSTQGTCELITACRRATTAEALIRVWGGGGHDERRNVFWHPF